MDMDRAAVFLAGSILITLGFIVVIGAIVIINNLLHKYWKPVRVFTTDSWNINPPMFVQEQVKVEPAIEPNFDNTKDSISKK